MQRKMGALAFASCFVLGTTLAVSAANLPDATYRCEMYSGMTVIHLGDIEVSGSTYRGPANDVSASDSYDYELTDAGTINWGGPMGGFDSGGNTIVSSVVKSIGEGGAAFDITMQLESGNFSTVSCSS